jgi:16S rRNA (guanine1207-N2)-methyltransferase
VNGGCFRSATAVERGFRGGPVIRGYTCGETISPVPHYFDTDPEAPSHPREVVLRLPEATVRLHSDAGVFGRGAVDRGTMFLLRRAPSPPLDGDILDLGTGYGPIAVTLGLRSPGTRVWAVDVNRRALELTARNAARAGADNVVAATPDEVPGSVRFAAIYSNPPVRIGLALLHPLLKAWLDRLRPAAIAHLVVHRHLGSDSLARWLAAQGFAVERVASHDGYRILSVRPRPVVGDDR